MLCMLCMAFPLLGPSSVDGALPMGAFVYLLLCLCQWAAQTFGAAAQCPVAACDCTADPLCDPAAPPMTRRAPAKYTVEFVTSAGNFTALFVRAWAPHGVRPGPPCSTLPPPL